MYGAGVTITNFDIMNNQRGRADGLVWPGSPGDDLGFGACEGPSTKLAAGAFA
jgi:hypothetical protein